MRLETALNTSRSGLDAHGKAISIVGDNVANANTTGYKQSRPEFEAMISDAETSSENQSISSTGSGVNLANVRQIHQSGLIESTGRTLDLSIDGQGFFMVSPDATNPSSNVTLTRAGNFLINKDGALVTQDGRYVIGSATNETGAALSILDFSKVGSAGTATTTGAIGGNVSSSSDITVAPTKPATFSEISKLAAFSAPISIYDSLGAAHEMSLYFFNSGKGVWTAQAYTDGAEVGGVAGTPTLVGELKNLTFGPDGLIPEANKAAATMTLATTFTGAAASSVVLDLSGFTQNASGSVERSFTRNGAGAGAVEKFEIASDGKVSAILSSGTRADVGYIQLGNVPNVDGLERAGHNAFTETDSTGTRVTGTATQGGMGGIVSGALERSTVDISEQFVNLVIYQRGYQANSQILSAASQLIRDTIGLVR